MEKHGYMKINTEEEIWNGIIGDIYPHLFCKKYNWEYFINLVNETLYNQRSSTTKIKILDTATGGCGEPSITLRNRRGYQVWATDGYEKMLNSAIKIAKEKNVDIEFSDKPVKFNELKDFYKKEFFDVVFCVANSISHVPPDQLDDTLMGMVFLLKEGGSIILDTKRYTADGREMECDENKKKGNVRTIREDPVRYRINDREVVKMETSFSYPDEMKAIYNIKIYYSDGKSEIFSFPFWGYTSQYLKMKLERIRLLTAVISPDICDWKYEVIVGDKK